MIKWEDECVGCPPNMGCLGSACPYRNVPHYYCDHCECECDPEELHYDEIENWICENCLFEKFPKIDVEE